MRTARYHHLNAAKTTQPMAMLVKNSQSIPSLPKEPHDPLYYYGLSGSLILLASTAKSGIHPVSSVDASFMAKKRFFPVDLSHNIVDVWESLLSDILQQFELEFEMWTSTPKIRSIHCIRIGYEHCPLVEPLVVILVVVQPNSVEAAAAVVVMRMVKNLCTSPRYGPCLSVFFCTFASFCEIVL